MTSPFSAFSVFKIEHPDNTVGIANRGYLRIRNNNGGIGVPHCQRGAALDAGRAVACKIQSNRVRSSLITVATPCSVRASLSRVCDAGRSHRL